MKDFVETIRDREKEKHYQLYAGINYPHLSCEDTFTNLKDRSIMDVKFHTMSTPRANCALQQLCGVMNHESYFYIGTLMTVAFAAE